MFYRERALRAQSNGCCIDVFCIGARQFGVTTLNCLVLSNAGTCCSLRVCCFLREYCFDMRAWFS